MSVKYNLIIDTNPLLNEGNPSWLETVSYDVRTVKFRDENDGEGHWVHSETCSTPGYVQAWPLPGIYTESHDLQAEYKKWQEENPQFSHCKMVPPYAAQCSVVYYLAAEPTEAEVEVIKKAARKIAAEHKLVITGFRLVTITTVVESREV